MEIPVVRPKEREFPRAVSIDNSHWFFDRSRMEAWWAQTSFLAAFTGLLIVSGSHQQDLEQQHENARARRVFRRWAWKHR